MMDLGVNGVDGSIEPASGLADRGPVAIAPLAIAVVALPLLALGLGAGDTGAQVPVASRAVPAARTCLG